MSDEKYITELTYWQKLSQKEKFAGFKSRKDFFNQNSCFLIPVRIKFYKIRDFNLPRKLSFTRLTTINSRYVKDLRVFFFSVVIWCFDSKNEFIQSSLEQI